MTWIFLFDYLIMLIINNIIEIISESGKNNHIQIEVILLNILNILCNINY